MIDETDPADPYTSAGQEVAQVNAAAQTIRKLAASGMTAEEIADVLKVADVSLIRRSRALLGPPTEEQDARVERALYEAAVGGRRVLRERLDKHGDVHQLEEEMPPDARAALAWSERRNPDRWGERKSAVLGVVILTPDELRERAAQALQRSSERELPALQHEDDPRGPSRQDQG